MQRILASKSIVTYFLLILCALLFCINFFIPFFSPSLPFHQETTFNPLKKTLLFDYPYAIALEDILLEKEAYTPLTAADEPAIKKLHNASYWGGFSTPLLLNIFNISATPKPTISLKLLCEKIGQGEIWRLFSPALLHASLLHLLFNMTWFYVLGKPLEVALGSLRYLVLILSTGILTNIAQYLFGGFAFVGFSGVILALASFTAARQRLFPDEGFYIDKTVYLFLKIMVFASAAFSLFLFAIECYVKEPLYSLHIAHAAHIAGLLAGNWFGRWIFFKSA